MRTGTEQNRTSHPGQNGGQNPVRRVLQVGRSSYRSSCAEIIPYSLMKVVGNMGGAESKAQSGVHDTRRAVATCVHMALRVLAVSSLAFVPAVRIAGPPLRAIMAAPSPVEEVGPPRSALEDNDAVVCARGVCVVVESDAPELCFADDSGAVECSANPAAAETKAWWPSALLLGASVLYGTNFPLGRLMNDAMPASASTSARMLFAALALSPFLLKLDPSIRSRALLCGTFTSLGYISQSIALNDTPAATVAFLGALTVVWCPALAAVFDGRKLGFLDAPQTWGAAILALSGVGLLELGGDGLTVGWGDFWSVLQAIGFGTSFYLTEKMMARQPTQALPITAAQCAVVAALAAVWAVADGTLGGTPWLLDEVSRGSYTLPGLLVEPSMRTVAAAALWTGLVTTAANRFGETTALGKLSSAEASVHLTCTCHMSHAHATCLMPHAHATCTGAPRDGAALGSALRRPTAQRVARRAGRGGRRAARRRVRVQRRRCRLGARPGARAAAPRAGADGADGTGDDGGRAAGGRRRRRRARGGARRVGRGARGGREA